MKIAALVIMTTLLSGCASEPLLTAQEQARIQAASKKPSQAEFIAQMKKEHDEEIARIYDGIDKQNAYACKHYPKSLTCQIARGNVNDVEPTVNIYIVR